MALAEVRYSCGRAFLSIAGVAVAMQGDPCRDCELPEDVMPPIPSGELEHASIGGNPCKDMPIKLVRFFRGDAWTEKMLEYVAARINAAAKVTEEPKDADPQPRPAE